MRLPITWTKMIGTGILTLAVCIPACSAQTVDEDACRAFVQSFYDRYDNPAWNYEKAFKSLPTGFDSQLRDLLTWQIKTQHAHPTEVTGLEFDPFLDAQDVDGHYRATSASVNGDACEVDVTATKIKLLVTIYRRPTGWQFTDIAYPAQHTTLVQILQQAQKPKPAKVR